MNHTELLNKYADALRDARAAARPGRADWLALNTARATCAALQDGSSPEVARALKRAEMALVRAVEKIPGKPGDPS